MPTITISRFFTGTISVGKILNVAEDCQFPAIHCNKINRLKNGLVGAKKRFQDRLTTTQIRKKSTGG
jgi:hypothetical protein